MRWRTFRTRLRASHPIVVLRWLRAGILGMVVLTALLYVVVANRAGDQAEAVRRTDGAIRQIVKAQGYAGTAKNALDLAIRTDAEELTGPGADFTNATAQVSALLTSAAEGNADRNEGRRHFQFVQGQLTTCAQLAGRVVSEGPKCVWAEHAQVADRTEEDGTAEVPFTGGLIQSLHDLEAIETAARDRQREARWLNPLLLWPLLTVPVTVMLLLVCATGYVVARHFRQYPSPALGLALLLTASVALTTCLRCRDGDADEWVMAIMLPLLVAAGALTYVGFKHRLAEYRFPHS
ncbi:hypothetical protein [Streptomyces sp. AS02]|uniref:hypothetical protein n=1 Tax=Streptomyces sp. AS02 TaxID=2938946 RepID=UPI002021C79B|nr:hypothetical protein [Streptomyces sp. AS02]MCL8017578.1 hypothetical protein [Streptomyces sp. AS02]